jgi:hypothetical protein
MSRSNAALVQVERLFPWVLDLVGPGSLDEHNPQDALIFDAGKHSLRGEPLADFYAREIWEMDWARDYLMDMEVVEMASEFDGFAEISSLAEMIEEEVYNKADLTTIESDSGWADAS